LYLYMQGVALPYSILPLTGLNKLLYLYMQGVALP